MKTKLRMVKRWPFTTLWILHLLVIAVWQLAAVIGQEPQYDDGGFGFILFLLFQITHGTNEIAHMPFFWLRDAPVIGSYDWLITLPASLVLSLLLDYLVSKYLTWARLPQLPGYIRVALKTLFVIFFIFFFLFSIAS